ncbi:MAG: hypothetical protein ACTSQ0_07455 [Candidatus Heimdallarchaeota archaeon]
MIQNLIIIKDSLTIFSENFGNCHKLNSDPLLLSAFFDALLIFANEFEQGKLEQLSFKNTKVHFYSKDKILFLAISDIEDKQGVIQTKLKKIAKFFLDKYAKILTNYSGETSQFKEFKNLLIEEKIAQINCGKYSECSSCPNRDNDNAILTEILKSDIIDKKL